MTWIAVGLVVLILIGWWGKSLSGAPPAAILNPGDSVDQRAERAPEVAEVTAAPARATVGSAQRETTTAAPQQARVAEDRPEMPGLVVLNGAAVRVDSGGVEHAADDGRFTAQWHRGAEFERRTVEVLGGRWSLELPPDIALMVRDLVLAGAPVSLQQTEFAVPPDRFLLLRGEARQGVLLHIVSAVDGRALDELDVWPSDGAFPTELRHPGAEPKGAPIVRGGASPVTLPARAHALGADCQYFVRAPGFAWGTIVIDHSGGGERTLSLQPACALVVELIGNADWLQPEVRLWPPDASEWDAYPVAQLPPDVEARAVFEALPPGTYLASVERGWAERRVSYGSASITLAPGDRMRLPIEVELPAKPVAVAVAGTLTLPSAWDRAGLKLAFGGEGDTELWLPHERDVPLTEMARLADSPEGAERFAWTVALPNAGSYRLEVFPLLVRELLEVPVGGLAGVEVVVPALADVEVLVTDVASGEEVQVESLHWSTPPIDGIGATPLYTAVREPGHQRVRFRAPAGGVRVLPIALALSPEDWEGRFTVAPGANRLELRVQRQFGVRFTFLDGEATVPWDWGWGVSAHQVGGEARDTGRSIGTLWFKRPGMYELRAEDIPGYRSIDGATFTVVDGDTLVDVTVKLTRD